LIVSEHNDEFFENLPTNNDADPAANVHFEDGSRWAQRAV